MEQTNTTLKELSVDKVISTSWALTKKHFPIFLVLTFLSSMVGSLPNNIYYYQYFRALASYGQGGVLTEDEWLSMAVAEDPMWAFRMFGWMVIGGIICWFLATFISLVTYRLLGDAVDGRKVDLTARLKGGLRGYWLYFFTLLLYGVVTGFATIFCILPGIFVGVRLMFAPMIAARHPEQSFGNALSHSWQMTKGNFWNLVVLFIVVCLINVLGLLCCCVGVYVTSIISYFVYAVAYKMLSPEEGGGEEQSSESSATENLQVVESPVVPSSRDNETPEYGSYNKDEK